MRKFSQQQGRSEKINNQSEAIPIYPLVPLRQTIEKCSLLDLNVNNRKLAKCRLLCWYVFSSLQHDSVILKLCGQKHFPVGQSISPMFCWFISPRYPHHTFVVKDIAASLPHYYPRGWCLNPGNFCKRAPMAPMAQNPIRIWGPKPQRKDRFMSTLD